MNFACGGLPKDPKPPLDYKIVFGGTRMPIRPGKVPMIVDGELKELDRYTEVESIYLKQVSGDGVLRRRLPVKPPQTLPGEEGEEL